MAQGDKDGSRPPRRRRAPAPIGDHAVGYGKPPAEHQFRKGAPSANPAGRPRRTAAPASGREAWDLPIAQLTMEEAMRPVAVRDGDKVVRIPAIQAALRATHVAAARGNSTAMRNLAQFVLPAQAALRAEKEEAIRSALEYRLAALERLAQCEALGIPFDWEVHPDDIEVDGRSGEVLIAGPLNPDEQIVLDDVVAARDVAIAQLQALEAELRQNPRRRSLALRIATLRAVIATVNARLPVRLQRWPRPQ